MSRWKHSCIVVTEIDWVSLLTIFHWINIPQFIQSPVNRHFFLFFLNLWFWNHFSSIGKFGRHTPPYTPHWVFSNVSISYVISLHLSKAWKQRWYITTNWTPVFVDFTSVSANVLFLFRMIQSWCFEGYYKRCCLGLFYIECICAKVSLHSIPGFAGVRDTLQLSFDTRSQIFSPMWLHQLHPLPVLYELALHHLIEKNF